jgi:hypothetical protein
VAGFPKPPLLVGVNVTGPFETGVMVNVCGTTEFAKLNTSGALSPPPAGVIVMVPV